MCAADATFDPLRRLEQRLLEPVVRASPAELAALLADDFVEFGSSGRVFTKREAIASLEHERSAQRVLTDFRATPLAPGVVVATHRLETRVDHETRYSLRSSIWGVWDGAWRLVFHQGTPSGSP